MAVNFDAIDNAINADDLAKKVQEEKQNGGFDEVPKGKYVCSLEKLEIGATKADHRPMFTMAMKIKEGEHKGRLLFMNRVIYGNKSEKWTDGKAIASVETILDKFGCEKTAAFAGKYGDFADQVADMYENLQGNIEVEIEYDAKAFNPITFTADDVYDLA